MMSMIVSFIIPHITFYEQRIIAESIIPVQLLQATVPTQLAAVSQTSPGFNWQYVLGFLLISGALFFFAVMIIAHVKVWWIVSKAAKKTLFDHSVRITNKDVPPFAYFGKLIIPSGILNSPHLQSVVCHEWIHAKGQHCIDLFLAEVLFLFQWFNPFAWLMKKAIKDNLEFLTDNEAIDRIEKQEYQLSMVSLASKNTFYTFPTISNQSQLKKRIIMIKKNTQSRFPWIKSLAIIPLLTILTATLSGREVQIIYQTSEIEAEVYVEQPSDNEIAINESKNEVTSEVAKTNSMKPTVVTKSVVVQSKKISGKVTDMDGKAIAGVSVTINGSTIGTETDFDGNFILNNIPDNVVLSFTMNGYDTKEVEVQNQKNINILLAKATPAPETEYEVLTNEKFYSNITTNTFLPIGINPLYVIDDKKYTAKEFDLLKIKPGEIASFEVHSWYTAEKYYGDEAINGAIVLKTKKNNTKDPNTFDFNAVLPIPGNPIYLVDGKKFTSAEFKQNELDPKDIASISILKDGSSISLINKFGEEAKNGVVLITTKDSTDKIEINKDDITFVVKEIDVNNNTINTATGKFTPRLYDPYEKSNGSSSPLMIIDGQKQTADQPLSKIDPADVKSISVLKGENALLLYGKEGKNGVVLITTKRKNNLREFIPRQHEYE